MDVIITTIRAFLASIYFDKWYAVFISVAVSLSSELIWSLLSDKTSHKQEKTNNHINNKTNYLYAVLGYAGLCLIFFAFCTLAYSFTKNGLDFHLYLLQAIAFTKQYWITMIAIPALIKLISSVIIVNIRWLKVLLIIFLFLAMIFAPSFLSFPNRQSAIKPLLLEHFQELPFPYITKFYDYKSILQEMSPSNNEVSSSSEQESLPDGSVDGLSIDQLMENARRCWNRDEALLKKYTEAAHQKYSSVETGSPFYIGLMWYYMGYIHTDAIYYEYSGKTFEAHSQFNNAGLAYSQAYKITSDSSNAEKAMQMYYNSFTTNMSQDTISDIEDFVCYLQNKYTAGDIPYLNELCELVPDNKLFKLIQVTRHIYLGTVNETDLALINQLLSTDDFTDYPKLLLMQAYYHHLYGIQYDADKIYSLYSNGVKFYPEDKLNLGWLMYANKEFGKAYKIAADIYKNTDASGAALLLIAEILLHDELQDELALSIDMRKFLDELTSASTDWYDEESKIRFQVITLLLGKETGRLIDVHEIASKSLQLFSENDFTHKYLSATAAYEEHDYDQCLNLCSEMLELELSGKNKHSVLFLQTDTLLSLAREYPDRREDYLNQAEKAMELVKNDVEDDYVSCLKRLRDIYEMSGNYEGQRKITDLLLQLD